MNAIIGYVEEARAESAVDALRQTLALKTRCWREGQLQEIDTSGLVPGDIIVLRLGDIVPADARLLGIDAAGVDTDGDLLLDQSALTGESLSVRKRKGEEVFSSTVVKQGQQRAIVTKTGSKTYIGRAAHLIASTQVTSHADTAHSLLAVLVRPHLDSNKPNFFFLFTRTKDTSKRSSTGLATSSSSSLWFLWS